MNADRQIGLLLPCNVAVRADTTAGGDAVIIDAMDPQVMVQLSASSSYLRILVAQSM